MTTVLISVFGEMLPAAALMWARDYFVAKKIAHRTLNLSGQITSFILAWSMSSFVFLRAGKSFSNSIWFVPTPLILSGGIIAILMTITSASMIKEK